MSLREVTATPAECELAVSTVLLVHALGCSPLPRSAEEGATAVWHTVLSRLGAELFQACPVPLSMLRREAAPSRPQAITRFRKAVERHLLDGSLDDRTRALGLLSLQLLRDIPVARHRLH